MFDGHSEFKTHSGLQFGGLPIYSERQLQDGTPWLSWHWEYGPQGDGMHGLIYSTGVYCGGGTKTIFYVSIEKLGDIGQYKN